jgi:glycerophosphoryl diester phosphodiesterase
MRSIFLIFILVSCSSYSKKTVIAHRGAPGYLPEHTLEGVAMAHSWGVDYIEPDIVITRDSQAVVLHDIHIDTTTDVARKFPKRKRADGRYYAVDFSLAEIKTLNVGERINLKTGTKVFPKRFDLNLSEFKVPTLEEFIELVQGLNKTRAVNIGIYPELKSPEFHLKSGKDIAKIVFPILEQYGYNKRGAKIYVQCFYPPTLKRLRFEFRAKMPLIALIAENDWEESSVDYNKLRTEEGIESLAKYVDGIGPYLNHLYQISASGKAIKTRLVEFAHKYKLKVHPYTHRIDSLPNKFNNSKELFSFLYGEVGVDGIFSDFGDVALKYSK